MLVDPEIIGILGGPGIVPQRRSGQGIEAPPFRTFVALLGTRSVERSLALAPVELLDIIVLCPSGRQPSVLAICPQIKLG
jgi:hypothetical protein